LEWSHAGRKASIPAAGGVPLLYDGAESRPEDSPYFNEVMPLYTLSWISLGWSLDYFPLKSFQATSILSEMIERAKKLEKKKVGRRKKKKSNMRLMH